MDPEPHAWWGQAYLNKKQFDAAIADYSIAISLDPCNVALYVGRCTALFKLGKFSDGITDLTRAISLEPDIGPGVYEDRAAGCFRLGQYDKAWADIKTCRKLGGSPNPRFVASL